MKNRLRFPFLLLVFFLSSAFIRLNAQTPDERKWFGKPMMDVVVNWADYEVFSPGAYPFSFSDYLKLAPKSLPPDQEFSGYSVHPNRGGARTLVGIGFNHPLKRPFIFDGAKLRIGISYLRTAEIQDDFNKTEIHPWGHPVYGDSLFRYMLKVEHTTQQLRLEAGIIYSKNLRPRWSVYTGWNISGGYTFNAWTDITRHVLISETAESSGCGYLNKSIYSSETVSNRSGGWGGSIVLPAGVNFQVGKKRAFWKRVNLFYEATAGFHLRNIPELGTLADWGLQQQVGLRVNLFNPGG